MNVRSWAAASVLSVCLLALSGCPKHHGLAPDASVPDAGKPTKPADAGMPDTTGDDGGLTFLPNSAGVPCPPEAYGVVDYYDDGGVVPPPEYGDGGMRVFGICVETRKLAIDAQLNEQPVKGNVDILLTSGGYEAELISAVDGFGHLDMRALKTRYDILNYHPDGIFPNHQGFQDFPAIDLTKNQSRTLDVKAFLLRGGARFATLPFIPQVFPPDVAFNARGIPGSQFVGTSSVGGTYEVNLMAGAFGLYLASPPAALGGTELLDYPVAPTLTLQGPTELDVDIATSELEGNITIDGKPIPDRLPGSDFQLEYTPSGGTNSVVRTYHDGNLSGFHSLIPQGKYAINLLFQDSPDRHLPAQIYNKQVAQTVDLSNGNATLNVDLKTYQVEGGILIDGRPPAPFPSYNWTLYLFGYGNTNESETLLYYEVPLDTADFQLRVFPNTYFAFLWLDDHFVQDLATGWYLIDRQYPVKQDTTLPISIDTAIFDGKLLVDGKPPPPGVAAGKMTFTKRTEGFYERTIVCNEDGTFRVRLPKGTYTMDFAIDRKTFPEYASGRVRMMVIDVSQGDVHANVNYDTVLVTGPIRLDGQPIPDSTPLEEVGLQLYRKLDGRDFVWGFNGGRSNYRLRLPEDDYGSYFQVNEGAYPDVAYGTAPFGAYVPAHVGDRPLPQTF